MGTQSHKTVVHDGLDFTLEYEEFLGEILLHCVVYKSSPSVFRRGFLVFIDLLNKLEDEGYSRVLTITLNRKFAEVFGGELVNEMEYGGKLYGVYQWDLKQQF